MKYKMVKRRNPIDPDAPQKWYASPMNDDPEDVKEMAENATENTTTAPIELEAALDLVKKYGIKKLRKGESFRLGDMGTLRITFRSEGLENLEGVVNPSQLIHDIRISFTPSKDFREQVVNNITFENGGVLDGGINYASLTDYRRKMGIPEPSGEPGVTGVLDLKTQKTDGTLTRGQMAKFTGNGLLLVGADGTSPGAIDFYRSDTPDMSVETVTIFGYNTDTEVVFVVPIDLTEGKYRVKLTTYYSGGDEPLEEPRVIECPEVTLV